MERGVPEYGRGYVSEDWGSSGIILSHEEEESRSLPSPSGRTTFAETDPGVLSDDEKEVARAAEHVAHRVNRKINEEAQQRSEDTQQRSEIARQRSEDPRERRERKSSRLEPTNLEPVLLESTGLDSEHPAMFFHPPITSFAVRPDSINMSIAAAVLNTHQARKRTQQPARGSQQPMGVSRTNEPTMSETPPDLDRIYSFIDGILPNMRDLAVSSCNDNIKPGLLFRSARPFSRNLSEIDAVLVKLLRLETIIDLRDDHLHAIPEEANSRLVVAALYKEAHVTHGHQEDLTLKLSRISEGETEQKGELSAALQIRNNLMKAARLAGQQIQKTWHQDPNPLLNTSSLSRSLASGELDVNNERRLNHNNILIRQIRHQRPELPDEIVEDIVTNLHTGHLAPLYGRNRSPRLFVINVLDSQEVKDRVMENVMKNKFTTLPLLVVCKAADRLTGTALAPFYFCKHIISNHEFLDSYIEMIEACGMNFCLALKVIALVSRLCVLYVGGNETSRIMMQSSGSVLFHCSLGKDRTGILAMLVLHVLKTSEQGIILDYALTEQASLEFRKYNYKFIVELSGLSEKFCGASAETMKELLMYIADTRQGTVTNYLDEIGFTHTWRHLLRQKYLLDPNN